MEYTLFFIFCLSLYFVCKTIEILLYLIPDSGDYIKEYEKKQIKNVKEKYKINKLKDLNETIS